MATDIRKERNRTLQDKNIAGFKSLRYALTEPILLRIARIKHEKSYSGVSFLIWQANSSGMPGN